MSRKSDHRVCAWLNEFDEDLELEDSDDSDAMGVPRVGGGDKTGHLPPPLK